MPWGPHSVPYLCDHDTSQFFRYPTRNTNEITSVVNAEHCAMIVLIISNIFFCLFLGIVQATRLHAPKHNDHDRFRREAESDCLKGAFILLIMVMVRSECGMGVSQMKSIMPSLVSNSMI